MNKKRVTGFFSIVILISFFPLSTVFSQNIIPRAHYLKYAHSAADWAWEHHDDIIQNWKNRFDPDNVFGYRPPGSLLETAVIYSFLFTQDQRREYAQRAKKILITYGDYRSIYPDYAIKRRADYADGVPALPDFFTVMRYIRAYDMLRERNIFSKSEHQKIETTIAESMKYLLRTQEWGPMNRTILRAESLAWAIRALSRHPEAKMWEMLRKALGDDNWGNWEIEDATLYHGVWLHALIGYASALNKVEDLFKTPEMYYYAHYFLNLMCPGGMIPDFGDSHWLSNWVRFLVYFETAAKQYNNPHMKWAASTIARNFIDFSKPTSVGLGYYFLDCYIHGSDKIESVRPESLSKEVMEDVQGKKIVFRNGWDQKSTYFLLNYRDEGDGGLNFRDYLRDTIPVEEEKMTHGHSDENSIVMLMSNGSILLHDGGYRDYMPSGPYGAFRQDYFHNRLCVRPEKIWMGQKKGEYRYETRNYIQGQSILEFFRNAGSYREVRTQKVDFITLPDFDYSRTRLIDDKMGYEWDRVVTYVKDPEFFVVFDIFKALKKEYFTLANLWHTRKITEKGDHWYDTVYDQIRTRSYPEDTHLIIYFPVTHFRLEGIEKQKRHFQDEFLIHQTTAQHFELGETVGFVTVLIPHPADESPEKWIDNISVLPVTPDRAGMGIEVKINNKTHFIAVKNDLRMDMSRDWRRPRYTYKAGKIKYGDLETNGDFVYASLKGTNLQYTIMNLTKALYKGKEIFAAQLNTFGLAYDGSPDGPGIGKLRYWRDEVDVER